MAAPEAQGHPILRSPRSSGHEERVILLSPEERISRINEELAGQGLRVLAVADRPLFIGLLGMQDPRRPEVPETLREAKHAGLGTIMITGDHAATAVAAAKQIWLLRPNGRVISGSDFARMSNKELIRVIDEVDVFAGVSPHHQVGIVEALRAWGEIVAALEQGRVIYANIR